MNDYMRPSDWQERLHRQEVIKLTIASLVLLVFCGVLIWSLVHKQSVTQVERVTADGQKVTCFVTGSGRFPAIACVPHGGAK